MALGTKSFWKASGGVAGLVILLAILVAGNILIGNLRLRADLTEEKLYTLSDGSRAVLKDLDRKVTLKLFFSSSTPEVPVHLKNYARQVEDLLNEYRMASGGKIVIETYDPAPDSDAEEWAQRYGIPGRSVGFMSPPIYFGIAAIAGKTEAVLGELDPSTQRLLEYNLTRMVYRVTHPEKPKVGVMSSLPVLGSESAFPMPGQPSDPPWIAFRHLREIAEVLRVDITTSAIPEELEALILLHPKELSDVTQYALDQYVLHGGRLLLFLDPLSVADVESQPQMPMGRQSQGASDLNRLLTAWGVKYDPTRLVGDLRAATRLQSANHQIEESIVWLSLTRANTSQDDILTTQLESLLLPFAGSLEDATSEDLTFTPLVVTSDKAGTVGAMSARFGDEALRRGFEESPVPFTLAARLSGLFATAFPEGPPADDPDDPNDDIPLPLQERITEGESTVVIVADSDMLFDRFCVQPVNWGGVGGHQPFNDNLNFLANAVEQLSGNAALISIRSRGTFNRPFDRVLDLAQKARDAYQEQEELLISKLRETQEQLRTMQAQQDENKRIILSPEQQKAIEQFREDERRISAELKQVRKDVRHDINRLGLQVKAINIALMPFLVTCVGISYGLYRHKKR